ncbi:hypothetical protein DL93DRAFT_2154576 [Clavulina sp. PMI_390]|nr:hypothetical protein DL93DRAFT_2154576 [Clavulina sp. PMI_390]
MAMSSTLSKIHYTKSQAHHIDSLAPQETEPTIRVVPKRTNRTQERTTVPQSTRPMYNMKYKSTPIILDPPSDLTLADLPLSNLKRGHHLKRPEIARPHTESAIQTLVQNCKAPAIRAKDGTGVGADLAALEIDDTQNNSFKTWSRPQRRSSRGNHNNPSQ